MIQTKEAKLQNRNGVLSKIKIEIRPDQETETGRKYLVIDWNTANTDSAITSKYVEKTNAEIDAIESYIEANYDLSGLSHNKREYKMMQIALLLDTQTNLLSSGKTIWNLEPNDWELTPDELMLGSSNHFFNQDKATLLLKRDYVWKLLTMKGYGNDAVAIYLKAYDYFTINPNEFDGATLVKDLCDIPDLDLDALIHDHLYLVYNAASNIRTKWMADMIFSKGMEQKGKGLYSAYSRFAGLTLSGLGFLPFARIKRGKITKEQKEYIENAYQIIVKQRGK